MGADEPNESLRAWAKGGESLRREGFGLVRIFTQRRSDAESSIGMSDCVVREIEIFGDRFTLGGGFLRDASVGSDQGFFGSTLPEPASTGTVAVRV